MRRSLLLAAVLLVASAVGISAQASCAITSVNVHEADSASNSFVYSPAFSSDTLVYSYTSSVAATMSAKIQVDLTTAQVDDTIDVSVNGQEYTTLTSGANSNSFSGTFDITGCLNIVALVRGPNCADRYYQLKCQQGFEVSSTGSSTPVGESSTGDMEESSTGATEASSTAASGFNQTESSTAASGFNQTESSTGASGFNQTESSTGASGFNQTESSTAASGFNETESSTGAVSAESSTAAEGFNTTESSTGAVSTASSTGSVSNRCKALLAFTNGVILSPPFQVGVVNYQCRGITAGGSTVISFNGASSTASSTGSAPAISSSAEAFSQSSSSASTPVTTMSSTGEAASMSSTAEASVSESSTASTPVTTESSTASTPATTESSSAEAFTTPSSTASMPVTTDSSTAQGITTPTTSTGTTYNYPYRRRLLQADNSYGYTDGNNAQSGVVTTVVATGSTAGYAYDANGNVYDSNGNLISGPTTTTSSGSALVDNGSTGQATPVTTTSTGNSGSNTDNGSTGQATPVTTTSTGSSNSGSNDMSSGTTTTTTTESSTAAEGFQISSTGNDAGGDMFQFGGVWYHFDANGLGQPITFVQGSNQIVIDVDGCPTFTITCDTEATSSTGTAVAPSSTAPEGQVVDNTCELSALQMANGMKFFPNFSPSVYRYSCSCANTVFLSTITATTFDEMAVVSLNNNGNNIDLLSGVESGSYEMQYGSNRLEIEVQGYANNVKGCSNTYLFTCFRGGSANDTTIMYNWYSTAYTLCSGVCTTNTGTMPGTFNRTVSCHDSNNNVVDDSYCAGTKPLSDSNCVTVCSTQNRDVIVGGNDDGAGVSWNSASSLQSSYFVALLAAFAAVMASIKF